MLYRRIYDVTLRLVEGWGGGIPIVGEKEPSHMPDDRMLYPTGPTGMFEVCGNAWVLMD